MPVSGPVNANWQLAHDLHAHEPWGEVVPVRSRLHALAQLQQAQVVKIRIKVQPV